MRTLAPLSTDACRRTARGFDPDALGRLDFLGRMPVPLRRAFKSGLDSVVARQRETQGARLQCCFLSGAEWYRPFDLLAAARCEADVPALLATTLQEDLLVPRLLSLYTDGGETPAPWHPAFEAGRLRDPSGIFRVTAAVPFVFLVDQARLHGRSAPRAWADLLAPEWQGEIVLGGWRPRPTGPYQDFNSYLLHFMRQRFGSDGLARFALNVRHLQHNVRTTTLMGTDSADVGAIAILPWLHADMCPRRQRVSAIWPEDGALAMPIGYLSRRGRGPQAQAIVDYMTSPELGRIFSHNGYPAAGADAETRLPSNARFTWFGWDYVYGHDMAAEGRRAAREFFAVLDGRQEERKCA